ncbi:DUF4386 domain-containing protein [Danxiaibacter flavus]|uniref:DUF4386 domain-containing protein n=1 Tax=Danxiaibacter flavus TaxID=3049108 RepID=A0ABV3ZLZ3_9BACT|nr:DUF4386 domain-containing protein [Chitinophagaceae bacterium DXS]
MNNHITTTSPNRYARIGGVTYLIIIAAGLFGEMFVRNAIIVPGNAAESANNIMASPLLWRIGIAGDLIMHIGDVVLMLMLYVLLKPVHKRLALLVVLLNLIQTAVLVANKLNLLLPLFLLQDPDYLKVFSPEQLQALAYIAVRTHSYGFGIGLIFFGAVCLVEGYLIYASGFLPKAIGIMMQIAGACYLINSFALILAPKVASILFPVIMIPPFIGELSLCLWLIIKGVNVEKWKERALAMK